MKKIFVFFLIVVSSCTTDYPKDFSEAALKEMLITQDEMKLTFREVLYENKGKKILINFWASWCKDCINDFPKIKQLQKEFPDVVYVFLSVDFGKPSWKKAIKKYDLKGLHYNLPKGMKEGNLVEFANLKWISRYMVIDENGKISLFKANKAADDNIKKALNTINKTF